MVFADTGFFIALLDRRDRLHHLARTCAIGLQERLVTSDWIVTEVADAFSAVSKRPLFLQFLSWLTHDPRVLLLDANKAVYREALELYISRQDKDWSLTDCTSFVIMKQQNLTRALTHDHHFEQAGFVALMR
jgi:uncharacterized protein